MENTITLSVSPIQAILSLIFQAWIIIFPIVIIRKLNYLTALLQDSVEDEDENA